MAYDRYESRRGWRDPRTRSTSDYGERYENRSSARNWDRDDDDRERGFFERAGDELASWFRDEDEDRRREDKRFGREDENARYERQARFRDEGYRRPYTGRFFGRRGFGDSDQYDRGYPPDRWATERREFTGTTSGIHDPHYSEWRRRQLDELDRDYDDYRRENQSRFESDFSTWRSTRQTKRQMLGQVREHMNVVGSDEEQVGTVDHVRGDRIILSKGDSEDGRHHLLSCSMIDRVEGDKVILDKPAAEAKQMLQQEGRDRGFFRDEDEREDSRMLNRAFSGTYER
jgi:hypothetical protein